jgi:hypothetical protein
MWDFTMTFWDSDGHYLECKDIIALPKLDLQAYRINFITVYNGSLRNYPCDAYNYIKNFNQYWGFIYLLKNKILPYDLIRMTYGYFKPITIPFMPIYHPNN